MQGRRGLLPRSGISELMGSRKQEHETRVPGSRPLLSDPQTGTSSGLPPSPFPLPRMFFFTTPHGPAMNKAMCVHTSSPMPSLWQGLGFHVPLS